MYAPDVSFGNKLNKRSYWKRTQLLGVVYVSNQSFLFFKLTICLKFYELFFCEIYILHLDIDLIKFSRN